MQTAQGSLTVLNAHTPTPSVYWNGREVLGIKRIHVHSDEDESRVKLVVSSYADEAQCAEIVAAGISVRVSK